MPDSILDRTCFWDCPPESFDPLGAGVDDAARLQYGLPPLDCWTPGSRSHLFRRRFLSRPSSGAPLQFKAAIPSGSPGVLPFTTHTSPMAPPRWPAQKSSNWSGASVQPREGRSLVAVMGNWTVPVVRAPFAGAATATPIDAHSSTWIGIDGQRHYRDSTLPQMGTEQIWNFKARAATPPRAWYQWWARGEHEAPQPLDLPLDAGDEVSALMTVVGPRSVRFNLKNETQGIILQAFDVDAPLDRLEI